MLAIQRLAITFGLLGLVPFVAGMLAVVFLPELDLAASRMFYLYSGGILAFMAGVYWPISMQIEKRTYPISPVHALLISQFFFVSAGLTLISPWHFQVLIYPILYILLYLTDILAMRGYWPDWYLKLRLVLTGVVVLCQLLVGAALFGVIG